MFCSPTPSPSKPPTGSSKYLFQRYLSFGALLYATVEGKQPLLIFDRFTFSADERAKDIYIMNLRFFDFYKTRSKYKDVGLMFKTYLLDVSPGRKQDIECIWDLAYCIVVYLLGRTNNCKRLCANLQSHFI